MAVDWASGELLIWGSGAEKEGGQILRPRRECWEG